MIFPDRAAQMFKSLRKFMSEIVTTYLISPSKSIECIPQLEQQQVDKTMWLQAKLGGQNPLLIESQEAFASPTDRKSAYTLQGINLPLFKVCDLKEPFDQAINLIVLFIAGSNSHIFACRQRAIECAYAAKVALVKKNKHAKVMLSRFNPFGVVNDSDASHQPMPYKTFALSQDDITQDYYQCARLLLNRHQNAQMIVMGHSLGGVFARKVFAKLKNSTSHQRVKFVYSAMSLPGIADAFMYYQPSRMLKNLLPKKNKKLISLIINNINKYGFRCIQRLLKAAVESSGWKTVAERIQENEIAQSNIEKKNLDQFIPDQAACVQKESMLDWLLSPGINGNCHDFPPSKLIYKKDDAESSELEKLIQTLTDVFQEDQSPIQV